MSAKILDKDGEPVFAVVPYADYVNLLETLEDQEDALSVYRDTGKKVEKIPEETIKRLVKGEQPVKVWRDYKGFTVADLSERSGLAPSMIESIEQGFLKLDPSLTKTLADALRIDIDDITDWLEGHE